MSGGGTPRGHLQDPSAVTLHLDPRLLGDTARGKEMFALAIDQQHTALSDYATAIAAADGDVTAPAVQDAATALHQALQFLPIAHTAYTGVGFPTARVGDGSRPTSLRPERGERGLGVHPDMLTAIHGDASQRWELACEEDLPLAVEITLATDPDENVRSAFLMGTRSRTVVLLMEQRETDPEMLEQLRPAGLREPRTEVPRAARRPRSPRAGRPLRTPRSRRRRRRAREVPLGTGAGTRRAHHRRRRTPRDRRHRLTATPERATSRTSGPSTGRR